MKNTTLKNIMAAMNINTVAFNEVCAYTTDTALRMNVAIKAVAEDGDEALIGRLCRYAYTGDDGNEVVYLTEMAMVMVIDGVTYEAADVLPVEIEALLDTKEFARTGIWEEVDLPIASNNVVIAMSKEEVEMMTKDQIRVALEAVDVELSNTEFKKTKKAELIAMLEEYLDPSKKVEVVEKPVVKEVGTPYEYRRGEANSKVDEELIKFLKAISGEIMSQTLQRNANGELVLREFALFYKATKSDCKEYMTLGKRLWGVVSKVVGNLYGEANKTSKVIQRAIDKMVECGLITKVASERTYVTLSPATMSQDEKDQLNDLWRTKDIKTEKVKDMVKATAITDNGKAVLNEMYPNFMYTATSEQMNTMFRLSK